MRVLPPNELAEFLLCPACRGGALRTETRDGRALHCTGCGRVYGLDREVISFLLAERLNETNKQEVAYGIKWEAAADELLRKEDWNPILKRQANWVMDSVATLIPDDPDLELCALGAGGGFELSLLLRRRSFARVFASDISPSLTHIAGIALADVPGELGLFASEFSACPIKKDRRRFGLVFQALHHAPDAHAALDTLLEHNFDDLLIVEPLTNPLFKLLARWDLVQRVEYSGTRPDWLDLARVKTMAKQRGMRVVASSWWEIPPYLTPPWLTKRDALWRPFCGAVEVFSQATSRISFGTHAAIKLTRDA